MLTVDVPVAGMRLRDVRNGFTFPPTLTLATLIDAATHLGWWINFLTIQPLAFASLSAWDRTGAELIDELFDSTMTMRDLEWVWSCWSGRLTITGVQAVQDARRMADAGAQQSCSLTMAAVNWTALPSHYGSSRRSSRSWQDRTEILVDTGIMSGADVVAAALGAKATLSWSSVSLWADGRGRRRC